MKTYFLDIARSFAHFWSHSLTIYQRTFSDQSLLVRVAAAVLIFSEIFTIKILILILLRKDPLAFRTRSQLVQKEVQFRATLVEILILGFFGMELFLLFNIKPTGMPIDILLILNGFLLLRLSGIVLAQLRNIFIGPDYIEPAEPKTRLAQLRHVAGQLSNRMRSFFMAMLNLAEVIVIYAWLYLSAGGVVMSASSKVLDKPWDALYFSVVTMTTLGYGDFYPVTTLAKTLSMLEVTVGIFFVVVVFALIITQPPTVKPEA